MNKLIILLACVVGLVVAGVMDHSIQDVRGVDRILRMSRDELMRQKFLLDVLLNVHQPLVQAELLQLAANDVEIDNNMVLNRLDEEMQHVVDLIRNHSILGKDDVFTITNDDHLRQMVGIYRVLVAVRDWNNFTRIVAHLRQHGNGVLLVNALLLAVRDREDTQMLIVPAIHEILSEVYMDEDVIRQVQNIDVAHPVTATITNAPGLLDIIGANKRNTMLNRGMSGGLGDMSALTRSNLWLPWRQMRMELAMQKIGGVGVGVDKMTNTMAAGADTLVVIPLNNKQMGMTTDDVLRTMLTDDMGLRSFVHSLVNDLILQTVNVQHVVADDHDHDNVNVGRVALTRNVGVGIHDGRIVDTMDMQRMGRTDRMMTSDRLNNMNRMDNMNRLNTVNRMDNVNRLNTVNRIDNANRIDNMNRFVGMTSNVRLEDTLPTTSINSDRLLHVNRRRLQGNTDVHINMAGRQTDMGMQNERQRFMNALHGGQVVHDGRHVVVGVVRGIDMDVQQNNRMNMYRVNNNDDMTMQRNMMGRTMMGHNTVDVDDMPWDRRGGMGVQTNVNRGILSKQQQMNLDMDRSTDDLPTVSVDSERLVHVNRRRLHQKIAMQNNLNGNNGRMDDDMMTTTNRMHQLRRDDVMDMDNQMNKNYPFMHMVHGGGVMDGRRVVHRRGGDVDDDEVTDRRKSIHRDDNERMAHTGGRWNKNMGVQQDDDDVQNVWQRRVNVGRGMENIGDVHRDVNVKDWQGLHYIGGGELNQNTWQSEHVVHNDVDDELDQLKSHLHGRMPRSLDMGLGMGVATKRILMEHLRGGEVMLHNLQQLVARINMETIALGITDLQGDEQNTMTSTMINRMNNMRLINNMDERFAMRMNEMRLGNRGNRMMLENLNAIETALIEVLHEHVGMLDMNHGTIDARDISVIHGIVGDILLGKVDHRINLLNIVRDILVQTEAVRGVPTVSDVGIVMHNPVVRRTIRHMLRVIDRTLNELLLTHDREDLELTGVKVNDVIVDKLRTMTNVVDHDLTNLLDSNVVNRMDDAKLVVVGRQQRLDHKDFSIRIDLTSDRNQQVVIRTLLVPTVNGAGHRMTIDQQRMNALVLDAHLVDLVNGQNLIQRKSIDIDWTSRDTTTMTDIYRRVMMTLDGNVNTKDGRVITVGQNCHFPHRLLLPRGQVNGLPMQLLVIVTRVEDIDRNIQQLTGIGTTVMDRQHLLCGLGVSSQNLDRHSLRFPLDRQIDSIDQLNDLSNVHLKDVLIMHDDKH